MYIDLFLNYDRPEGQTCLLRGSSSMDSLSTWPLLLGDSVPCRLWFLKASPTTGTAPTPISVLSDGMGILFGAKATSNLSAAGFLFSQTAWTAVTDASGIHYEGILTFDSPALRTAIASANQLPLTVDVRLVNADNTSRLTYQFSATCYKGAILGTEGVPASGDPVYPLPSQIALKSDLVGLTGIKLVQVADAASRFALTAAQVNVGDLVEQLDTREVYQVIDTGFLTFDYGYINVNRRTLKIISLPDSLVAFWNMDEESGARVDASGNGNSLSATNSPGSTPGLIGLAATSAGSSRLDSGKDFGLRYLDGYSVFLWINTWSTAGAVISNFYDGWELTINQNGTLTTAYLGDGTLTSPASVADSMWHHIGLVKDGDNYSLIVDGVNVATENIPGQGPAWGGEYFAFFQNPDGNDSSVGAIDMAGIWSRALSADEISELYNSGNGLAYPFA